MELVSGLSLVNQSDSVDQLRSDLPQVPQAEKVKTSCHEVGSSQQTGGLWLCTQEDLQGQRDAERAMACVC